MPSVIYKKSVEGLVLLILKLHLMENLQLEEFMEVKVTQLKVAKLVIFVMVMI